MKLTDEQLAAIECVDSKILVKAGAGTGKTEVLTRRIMWLLEKNPELSITEMAIITFTNKATEELQSRLKKAFYNKWKEESDPDLKQKFRYELESLNFASISTIHSFCKNILCFIGPYQDDELIYSPNFKVRSDQLFKTIDQTIEEWIFTRKQQNKEIEHLNYIPVHRLKENIKKIYLLMRQKGLNVQEILKCTKMSSILEKGSTVRKLKYELIELIELVLINHQKYKFGKLDTDDLLEYCAKILSKRPDLNHLVKSRYKYIFVDEFQDTSLYQTEILKNICDDSEQSPSLFVVGDEKQSIYEFRGANPNAYLQMENWIRDRGTIIKLTVNWRSTSEVVTYVNYVFDKIRENELYSFKNEPLVPKEQKSHIDMSKAFTWILSNKKEDQGTKIAYYLKEQIDKGIGAENFAILVRKNYEIGAIAEKLKKIGIEFEISDSGNFYNQPEIVQIYKVLKSVIHHNPISVAEACSTMFFKNNKTLYMEIYNDIIKNNLKFDYTPSQLLDFIFRKTKIYDSCSDIVKANLNKLKENSRKLVKNENISLYHYVNWLSNMILGKVEEPLADTKDQKDKGKVKIMTIHKAKGLEFPNVILPHLDQPISEEAIYPTITINQSKKSIEFCYEKYFDNNSKITSDFYEEAVKKVQYNVYSEELRVLYVALTRAKEKLVLVGSEKINKKNISYQRWLKED